MLLLAVRAAVYRQRGPLTAEVVGEFRIFSGRARVWDVAPLLVVTPNAGFRLSALGDTLP